MKRTLSILFALLLVFSMVGSAFATEGETVDLFDEIISEEALDDAIVDDVVTDDVVADDVVTDDVVADDDVAVNAGCCPPDAGTGTDNDDWDDGGSWGGGWDGNCCASDGNCCAIDCWDNFCGNGDCIHSGCWQDDCCVGDCLLDGCDNDDCWHDNCWGKVQEFGWFFGFVSAIDLNIYRQWEDAWLAGNYDHDLPSFQYLPSGATITFFLNGVPVPADVTGTDAPFAWSFLEPTELGNWEAELTLPTGYRLVTTSDIESFWNQSLRISFGDGSFDVDHDWFITATSGGGGGGGGGTTTPPVTGPQTGDIAIFAMVTFVAKSEDE